MLGKYINQFMTDNELSVNEEFFIKDLDGNRVLISFADRYKIEDIDGGILTTDERIKELKKQGYISGVMAGKRIRERMQVIPDLCAYNWHKLYQHLMDNAKNYVLAEPVDVYGTLRWYYNENDLLNWIVTNLNNCYWLKRHFLKKEAEKC